MAMLVTVALLTAPSPPSGSEPWRWAVIATAGGLGVWNLVQARYAYRAVGLFSVVGFLHLWMFFSFSFPAVEMTFRYDVFRQGLWEFPTNDPLLFRAVVLLAVFQGLFFLALGRQAGRELSHRLQTSASGPHSLLALLFFALAGSLLFARLVVLRNLGVDGVVATMVTRTDYFSRLTIDVGPLTWVLNALFPIYAVALLCLGVKYLVPHPSRVGRRLYLVVLTLSAAGVALSGGRADLVYVVLTVVVFLYAQGYRSTRLLWPLVTPVVLIAAALLLVAQARHGADNPLTQLASEEQVGQDYSSGDVTQLLGLGRFDTMVMILDRHELRDNLSGSSYADAAVGAANVTFLPRIATGLDWPTRTVSSDVLGYWIFGYGQSSALPSAPGELYLNFGPAGVVGGALVVGFFMRILLRASARLPGPLEFAWVLGVWTLARWLSDESYLIMSFALRNWPVMILLTLLLASMTSHGSDRTVVAGPAGSHIADEEAYRRTEQARAGSR